jgi:hypothetical protein
MKAPAPVGICPMCRKEAKLINSHLISSGVYPLCQNEKREHVTVTSDVMRPTQMETKKYLLCSPCDNSLNTNGEGYVIPLLSRLGGPFLLYDRLVKQEALEKTPSMTVYAAVENPEIDVAMLIHFGIGILWKASNCSFGNGDKPRIDLSREDREAMRRFLLGEAELPMHMALAVAVESGPIRYPATIEPRPGDNSDFKNFFFYVPGVMFQLYIGDNVRSAKGAYSINLNPKGSVMMIELAKTVRGNMSKGSRNARKTKKLLQIMEEVEAKGLNIKLGD